MVGVPGRSKGCNTCIRRKIRCDQETPFCGSCRKSNRLCTGYQRKLGYVFSGNVSLPDLSYLSSDDTTVSYQDRWRKCKQPQPATAVYHVANSAKDRSTSLSLCHQVSLNTAFRQQFHSIFLSDFLPVEMMCEHSRKSGPLSWLLDLQDIVIESPALESSIAALCSARVGRKNNDHDLVHRSRSMYVSSLELVQQAIRSPKTRFSDETLAACMALLHYELTEHGGSDQAAIATHGRGAMVLLLQRGTAACTSPLGHSLFITLRAQSISTNLIRREETFLSSTEWLEKPWKSIQKSPLDELNDILYELPAIFRRLDVLSSTTCEMNFPLVRNGFRATIKQFLDVACAMKVLFGDFERSVCGPLFSPELSKLQSRFDDNKLGRVFPISFKFSAFSVAQFTCTYWSGMMAVHNQLMFAFHRLSVVEEAEKENSTDTIHCPSRLAPISFSSKSPPSMSSPLSCAHHTEWKNMAKNICQSAEYHLQDKMGEFGPLTLLMLLSGCYSCFKHFPVEMSREIGWIVEVQSRIKERSNLPFLDPYENPATVQLSDNV